MNVQSIIIVILIVAAVISAIAVYKRNGSDCSCGGSCRDCTSNCKRK